MSMIKIGTLIYKQCFELLQRKTLHKNVLLYY